MAAVDHGPLTIPVQRAVGWTRDGQASVAGTQWDLMTNQPLPGPLPSSAGVAARMSRQARADTAPEMALRRLLHANGKRYRVGWPVPGMPRRRLDLAFTKAHVAVNVHGCFWHGCPLHATWPASNADWWRKKIEKNQVRDRETREHLEGLGWTLVEIWEHEPAEEALARVLAALG